MCDCKKFSILFSCFVCLEGPRHEFFLSDEYRRVHFLSGLLLCHLNMTLNEASNKEQRQYATQLLFDLMRKHAHDKRYRNEKVLKTFFIKKIIHLRSYNRPFFQISFYKKVFTKFCCSCLWIKTLLLGINS